jgi:REP element-mobilizing transposase RayT
MVGDGVVTAVMARPLRVDVKDGWYHVTARGIERMAIFEDDRDHEHFLELLEEMSKRYGVEVHVYCLLGNHYHLLIQTPRANASPAVQWLNVSYSVWFNKKRGRSGHVFQGRFGSVLIDGEGSLALDASVYIHLNPIRTEGYGLGKSANKAEAMGWVEPDREQLKRRLKALRQFQWSSFRAYAGYSRKPEWLVTDELTKRGGRQEYRRYVQEHVTRGADPEGFEDFRGRLALGSVAFQEKAKGWVKKVTKEQPMRKCLKSGVGIATIVRLVEDERGESWAEFANRYGDWGRELVMYLARKRSGLTLREIGDALDGVEYKNVSKAVRRFADSLANHSNRRKIARSLLSHLANGET